MNDLNTIKRLNGEYPSSGDQVVEDPSQPISIEAVDFRRNGGVSRPVQMPYDMAGAIITYEGEGMPEGAVVELFQHLVNTGLAWKLQGSYGRMAVSLIEAGLVRPVVV